MTSSTLIKISKLASLDNRFKPIFDKYQKKLNIKKYYTILDISNLHRELEKISYYFEIDTNKFIDKLLYDAENGIKNKKRSGGYKIIIEE